MKRYVKTNPGGVYEMNTFYDTGRYKLYAKTCKGEGIPCARKTCMGVRFNNCHAEWTNKNSGYKDFVQRRGRNFTSAMRLINSPALSDKDETTMNKLIHTYGLSMNKGLVRDLITMVNHWLELYREAKVSCVVSVILHQGRPKTFSSSYSITISSRYRKYQSVGRSVDPPMLRQFFSQTVIISDQLQ